MNKFCSIEHVQTVITILTRVNLETIHYALGNLVSRGTKETQYTIEVYTRSVSESPSFIKLVGVKWIISNTVVQHRSVTIFDGASLLIYRPPY